ncbi:MAG: tyrosine-type recombinase/integrase [Myxococcaceae bacterium]
MNALARQAPGSAAERLVAAFLAGRNAETRRAYSNDLADFAAFLEVGTVDCAAELLLGGGHGAGNELALAYRAHLVEKKLAAATINRRLAALRSLVKLGRVLGMVPWTLEVPNEKAQPYRDTRGPGRAGFLALLEQLRARSDAKGARDRAIVRLLYERALRCVEVRRLDLVDVDLDAGVLQVLGKGRKSKEPLTIAGPTLAAVKAWIVVRGTEAGPLFTNLDRAHKRQRISSTAVYDVVRQLGEAAGIRARPHGLRHAAITEALDRKLDVRAVQRFSRHRDLRILLVYDDNRADLGGEVTKAIAEQDQAATVAG